ncbi:MAG: hypothetical protein RLZZ210_994 [Pseudomonadota bacterium]
MASISQKRQVILKIIEKVSAQPNITLIAVSKTFPIDAVLEAFNDGQLNFGENYVQEAIEKIKISPKKIIWHFIGSIQSNKTKDIAENFAWVHTVDRDKIAKRLSEQRPKHLNKLQICLQINVDNAQTKSGIIANSIADIKNLVDYINTLENIELRGLMAIPDMLENNQANVDAFKKLHTLFEELKNYLPNHNIDTLCMGMSADFEKAIQYGSNMVRIGSAIFGIRNNN